jgi:hypothetical protein
MIKDSSRPCDGTHFFNEWAAFTTSLNISSESGRTFGDACQLFYCIFAGILDMRKGRKLAWLLGFRLRLTTLVTGTVIGIAVKLNGDLSKNPKQINGDLS